MNTSTWIALLLLSALLVFAVRLQWRARKAAKSCGGSCAGCAGCPSALKASAENAPSVVK